MTGALTGFKELDLAASEFELRVTSLVTFGLGCDGDEKDLGTESEIERGLVNFCAGLDGTVLEGKDVVLLV